MSVAAATSEMPERSGEPVEHACGLRAITAGAHWRQIEKSARALPCGNGSVVTRCFDLIDNDTTNRPSASPCEQNTSTVYGDKLTALNDESARPESDHCIIDCSSGVSVSKDRSDFDENVVPVDSTEDGNGAVRLNGSYSAHYASDNASSDNCADSSGGDGAICCAHVKNDSAVCPSGDGNAIVWSNAAGDAAICSSGCSAAPKLPCSPDSNRVCSSNASNSDGHTVLGGANGTTDQSLDGPAAVPGSAATAGTCGLSTGLARETKQTAPNVEASSGKDWTLAGVGGPGCLSYASVCNTFATCKQAISVFGIAPDALRALPNSPGEAPTSSLPARQEINFLLIHIGMITFAARSFFARYRLVSNVASYGALSVSAEFTQQTILRHWDPSLKSEPYDWPLLGRYAVYSMCLAGPGLYYWFRFLDRHLAGTSFRTVVYKALTDQLVSSTACIAIFYTSMSIMEGKDDIFAELRQKFIPTYKVSCCFWIPVQCLNFLLVPPQLRVIAVSLASFIWCNVLCIYKRALQDS